MFSNYPLLRPESIGCYKKYSQSESQHRRLGHFVSCHTCRVTSHWTTSRITSVSRVFRPNLIEARFQLLSHTLLMLVTLFVLVLVILFIPTLLHMLFGYLIHAEVCYNHSWGIYHVYSLYWRLFSIYFRYIILPFKHRDVHIQEGGNAMK